jgi:CheY-like chemotaxis protein
LSGSKILIAEDDSDISAIYSFILKQKGYDIAIAQNGDDALAMASTYKPDLMLLDIMMPGMDGLKVLEKMRTQPANAGAQPIVIVMTNLDRQDLKLRAKELGANGYVVKANIVPHDIPVIVQQALERTPPGDATGR